MLHYFSVTALVLIGARLAMLLLLGLIDRAMRPAPDTTTISPAIDARLRIYHPVVAAVLRLTIYTLCVLGLLQLYGMNTFFWLVGSDLGLRLLSAIGTIAATIVFAFGVWEAVNAYVHSHLDRLQREAQMARSARLRTLLPLLRSALLISIAVVAVLMVLSEVGINIAPLLAGAGIVGVAIGFGSQKLVQDLITGIFLLLENAMQVGDWVTVSGLSGTVEALTVRTMRLRAADGSVHLIPFSAVTSITNVNRGLGNAAVNVVVNYEEDTDRVAAELKVVADGMRAEPAFSAMMLSDLQLWGVDRVDGAGVTITGQVVCTDQGRWPVQREFNRRMKRRFQELGIRIFNPVQTISVTAEFPAPPPVAPVPGLTVTAEAVLVEKAPVENARSMCTLRQLTDQIHDDGYSFVRAPEMRGLLEQAGPLNDWQAFAASWDDLGRDTYMADGGRYRKRRHGVFSAGASGSSPAAAAALPEPRLQHPEWRHRALV